MSGHRIKLNITLFLTVLTLAFMCNASAQTEDTAGTSNNKTSGKSESYLKEIRDILLINVNKLPIYLNQLTKTSLSWLAPDDSDATAHLQQDFTDLASANIQNEKTILETQNQLTDIFLSPSPPKDAAYITYRTLLQPPPPPSAANNKSTDPYANLHYILNASGINIKHEPPQPASWKPSPAVDMYKNFYYTASAVQTYNGYILSELYANSQSGNEVKSKRDSLVKQASQSDWFTQIASENLGIVLRQILLYNSQTYVLLTQLLQTQQKLLASQAMNNALLIAVNQEAENRLYSKAAGTSPV